MPALKIALNPRIARERFLKIENCARRTVEIMIKSNRTNVLDERVIRMARLSPTLSSLGENWDVVTTDAKSCMKRGKVSLMNPK